MWPCSQHFLDTLARSHTQQVYLEILKDGKVITTLQNGVILDPNTGLPMSTIGGSIDVGKDTIRRSGKVTFIDVSGVLLPESVDDLLAPYSTEVRVWAGVQYWDAPLPAVATTEVTAGAPTGSITLKQSTKNGATATGTTIAQAYGGAVSSGSLLVAFASCGTNTTITFSDGTNTWHTISTFFDSTITQMFAIGYAENAAAGTPTVTATFGTSAQFRGLIISEFTNILTSGSLDKNTAGQHLALSTTPTDSTMTTTANGELVVSVLQEHASVVPTAGPGFSTIQTENTGSGISAEWQVQGNAGPIAPSFGINPAEADGIMSATFKTSITTTSSSLAVGAPVLQPSTEFVPVATLVITDLDSQYPEITITGYDRMWLLGRFQTPYSVAVGTEIIDAVNALLSANVPSSRLFTNFPSQSELTTPAVSFDAESNIADAVHSLAQTAGWQIYCDPMGIFTITHEPTTDDAPVFSYAPGQYSTMFRPQRTIGGDFYNAVVYTGEGGTTAPVRGYAQDDDPKSLTYVGRVGTRVYFGSSPLVTTTDQANKAAKTTLYRILGAADTIVVPVVPNPALETGDVIQVSDPQQQINLPLLIDSFSVPLRAADGEQQLTCRSQVIR
jgi:hypothetical protein